MTSLSGFILSMPASIVRRWNSDASRVLALFSLMLLLLLLLLLLSLNPLLMFLAPFFYNLLIFLLLLLLPDEEGVEENHRGRRGNCSSQCGGWQDLGMAE